MGYNLKRLLIEYILRQWDPLGVHPGTDGWAPKDEYNRYVKLIINRWHSIDASHKSCKPACVLIEDYLRNIEIEYFEHHITSEKEDFKRLEAANSITKVMTNNFMNNLYLYFKYKIINKI